LRASTDAAINKVVSLFCTQFQESAARGLDDSQVDARGELDFHLFKDIVEQGRAEAQAMIRYSRTSIGSCSRNITLARTTLLSVQ